MRATVHGFSAGTVFGFPIYVEMTALYMGPWIILVALTQSSGGDLVRTLVFFTMIPLSVLAHELGHALAARALNVPVRHIALTWFGGYASFWLQPKQWREAIIALAGPAANLVIGTLLWIAASDLPSPNSIDLADSIGAGNPRDIVIPIVRSSDLTWFEHAIHEGATINLALGIFNLLPGLPLDGGHILRVALGVRMSRGRASWVAAWTGFAIGMGAVAYAIWIESFWLLIVGGFVGYSAWLERRRLHYE
jgi:Zn-dependent protease